jgi:ABC-type lipoprotein export system ATPase subunit
VFRLFEGLVDEGKTILMVTHDHDLAKRVTRTIILSDGVMLSDGEVAETRQVVPARSRARTAENVDRVEEVERA